MSTKLSLLFFMISIVSACSQVTPFEDRRREAGTEAVYVGSSKPNRPAFCYNPLFNDENDLLERANAVCKANNSKTHAVFVKKDRFSCRLFLPAKAYYNCVKDN